MKPKIKPTPQVLRRIKFELYKKHFELLGEFEFNSHYEFKFFEPQKKVEITLFFQKGEDIRNNSIITISKNTFHNFKIRNLINKLAERLENLYDPYAQ